MPRHANCPATEAVLDNLSMKNAKRRLKGKLRQEATQEPRAAVASFAKTATSLAEIGKGFYARGWVLGTSGNFSAVASREPLRLAITSTGLDKGGLVAAQFIEMDDHANVVRGDGRPSAEALHTHSVWSTVLSASHAPLGGIALEGYEMLKGLEGVRTHKHREWVPILENSQDMMELAERVSKTLQEAPDVHGFLLKGHGLYTWGESLQEAKRHVEILEFLMEVLVRSGAAQTA
jgi:methylthioribulose-1-phosphate dehydratase